MLCAATAVNVAGWTYAAARLGARKAHYPPEVYAARRRLLWLAAAYVLGCGFRSVLPMVDVPRICLHETWISRIFAGRSIATLAELCFAMQWALILREAGEAARSRFADAVSRLVMPIIVAAEIFSWSAVLTSHYLLHAVENALWTLAAALSVAGFVHARPRLDLPGRRLAGAAIACGLLYVAYMVTEDVPMYVSRWQADLAAGHSCHAPAAGLSEVLERCTVAHDWTAWRDDVGWLTLYFTVAVWISIALSHAPALRPRPGTDLEPDCTVMRPS